MGGRVDAGRERGEGSPRESEEKGCRRDILPVFIIDVHMW